jgi:ATP-dependent RNA helicase RhlE
MTKITEFTTFGLDSSLLEQVKAKGYTTPTQIQMDSIPSLLEKRDLLGIAQTGSGKTAAYSLPILHKFIHNKKKMPANCVRCLILAPTRELASQIQKNIDYYGKILSPATAVVFGGVSKSNQITNIECGLDFLVATPGRLLDLMRDEVINYSQLDTLILDEADTMLDMGFLGDVQTILNALPAKKQTLLFSATMPKVIQELATNLLDHPKTVEVTPEATTVETIDQSVYFVDKRDKLYLLLSLLENDETESILIFCKTKFGVDHLVENLEKSNYTVESIHSKKTQGAREKALNAFRNKECKILVATDIAARGIDIDHISHVVNYNLPEDPSNYVHRIGRTARAGRTGKAITLCVISELSLLKNVEKKIRMKIPQVLDQPFHKEFTKEALAEFKPSKKKANKKNKNNFRRRRR